MRAVSKRWFLSVAALAAAAMALPLSGIGANAAEKRIEVVATTGHIADLVRAVGGERVNVRQLMGEGVDPHLYQATRSDMASMLAAQIIFYNGLLLEGRLTDALAQIAKSGKPVHAVAELVDRKLLLKDAEDGKEFDPHLWMDPRVWEKAAEVVRDRLVAHAPNSADAFRANAASYIAELRRIDAYAETSFGSVPKDARVLVTAHDAFGYLGRRYGFEVLGIQGLSTESEAGLKQIEELVATLVQRKIPAVFVETSIPERSIQALIAGAKAKGHKVAVGGELFSDAMGAPGTYEGTYIGMMDHNATIITRALGGKAPQRGLNGRLSGKD